MTLARDIVLAIASDPEALQALADALRELEPPTENRGLLDLRAAATYLGLSEDALGRRARRGAIPSMQEGPRCKRFFTRDDLEAWKRAA